MPASEREEGLISSMVINPVVPPRPLNKSLKYARIEEERRYLVASLPQEIRGSTKFMRIVDYYIAGTRLRLRRMESSEGEILAFKLGQKYQPEDLQMHQAIMTNMYLDEGEYRKLRALGGAEINKRRYAYEYEELLYSLDVFEGSLQGMILAEIERRPGIKLTSLPIPTFAALEVTGDPRFNGGHLAALDSDQLNELLSSIVNNRPG
jgi:CYTH domain-containing protein